MGWLLQGLCIWSPRLDDQGNSVRAVEFCQRLTDKFAFHVFDDVISCSEVSTQWFNSHTLSKHCLFYLQTNNTTPQNTHGGLSQGVKKKNPRLRQATNKEVNSISEICFAAANGNLTRVMYTFWLPITMRFSAQTIWYLSMYAGKW